jgi:hypothetical protein
LRSRGHRRSNDLKAPWLRPFIPPHSFGADPVAASSTRGHEGASLLGPKPSSLRELGLALPVEVTACATSLPGARPPHRLSPPDSSSTMYFSAGSSCSYRRRMSRGASRAMAASSSGPDPAAGPRLGALFPPSLPAGGLVLVRAVSGSSTGDPYTTHSATSSSPWTH